MNFCLDHTSSAFSGPHIKMSSRPLNNLDHEDCNVDSIPFHASDDLWQLLEDDSTFQYIDNSLDPNITFHEENSLAAEASDNNPCMLLHQEKSMFPIEDETANCKWDSYLSLEQQNSAMAVPITEECSMTLSNKSHDTSGSSGPSTFLEQESSELEPSTDTELLLQNLVNYCNDNIFSNFAGASGDPCVHGEVGCSSLPLENHESGRGLESSFLTERETSAVATSSINKPLPEKQLSAKKKERNNTTIEEHNAKERVRRMKLYATYLSLGALLPDSENRKKRSAPVIIDRALEYIPELENEIEKLTLKKNNMLSKIENKQRHKQNLQLEHEAPSVLVHEVKKGEVIIQTICSPKDEKTVFSKLLQNLEAKEKCIISVSTLCVCEKRVCYHLHVQMTKDSLATDYVEVLRQDVISWLL